MFNGKPVLRFTGSQNMSISDLMGMQGGDEPFTVFAVASTTNIGKNRAITGFGDTNNVTNGDWEMRHNNGNRLVSGFFGASVYARDARIFAEVGKQAVVTMSYAGGGVGVLNQLNYENGARLDSAMGSGGGAAVIAPTPEYFLGSAAAGDWRWEGDIAEVVIYTRVLSDAERQQVEAYLAQKWMDEPYPSSCNGLGTGTFTIDTDGYNGPAAPVSVSCP